MICRVCGEDKAVTPEYWCIRNGKPDGHVCKLCKHGHPKLIPICHHCHKPILDEDGNPGNANLHYHRDNGHPACQQAYRLNHLHAMRKWERANGRKRKQQEAADKPAGRPCPKKCGKCRLRHNGVALLPQNYHYACPDYYARHHSVRIDDDYIYMAWGYAGHPKPRVKDEMEVER